MTKSAKKVAKLAAGVSKEAQEIEAALEAEVKTPIRRTVILPEGMSGKQLARKVIPQTSERAVSLIPSLKPKVDAAKEAAKEGTVVKGGIIAKAKAAKADKDVKAGKTAKTASKKGEGKYANNITSMEKLADWCLAQKFTDAETEKVFVEAYKVLKNETNMAFIRPRIVIYKNIAVKHAAKVAEALTKAEAAVVKEKMVRKVAVK